MREITLETITPLWTGDLDSPQSKQAGHLRITGLMGSLRWWYEVIVRGLGGRACDPGARTCQYDTEQPDNGLCDVCLVFGSTGWARRFHLTVADSSRLRLESGGNAGAPVSASPPRKAHRGGVEQAQPPRWWPGHGLQGTATLRLVPVATEPPLDIIGGLLQFIASWGSLGARPQLGYGVVRLRTHQNTQALRDWTRGLGGTDPPASLPSLQNMFFAAIDARGGPNEYLNLKYDLRRLFPDRDVRHLVMGTVEGEERQGAKIVMSRPYDGRIRVWGWVPSPLPQGVSRGAVLEAVHGHLTARYGLQYWREMRSTRDAETPSRADPHAFFESLLERPHA